MACGDPSPSQLKVLIVLMSASLSLGFLGTIAYAVFKDGKMPLNQSPDNLDLRVQGSSPALLSVAGLPPLSVSTNASKPITRPARKHVRTGAHKAHKLNRGMGNAKPNRHTLRATKAGSPASLRHTERKAPTTAAMTTAAVTTAAEAAAAAAAMDNPMAHDAVPPDETQLSLSERPSRLGIHDGRGKRSSPKVSRGRSSQTVKAVDTAATMASNPARKGYSMTADVAAIAAGVEGTKASTTGALKAAKHREQGKRPHAKRSSDGLPVPGVKRKSSSMGQKSSRGQKSSSRLQQNKRPAAALPTQTSEMDSPGEK